MTWQSGPLKHWLALNDSGVWGQDPDGVDDVEVLRSTDIALDGRWDIDEPAVRAISGAERASKSLQVGDLVVVKSSGSEAHLGKTAIVTPDVAERGACFANFVQRLRPSPSADSRYVWYVLNSRRASDEMSVFGNTSTGLRNLNGTIIGQVTFPGPPLVEQRAVADYLDTETARIDALIAKKRRLIATVQERFERTVHRDVEALVAEAGSVRLKRLAAISVGIVITPAAWYSEVGGVPALRGMNVRPRRLLVDDLVSLSEAGHLVNKKSELRAGDIVVVRTGQAGAAAVVPPSFDGCNCIDLLIVRRSPDLDPEFLSFVLNSEWVSKQIAEFSVGAIQSHFNVGALKELIVPPVPPEDQRGVAARWEALEHGSDAVAGRLERQIELLLEHRQALITAAVTGELEVPGVAA